MTDEQQLEKPSVYSLIVNTVPLMLVVAGVAVSVLSVTAPMNRILVFAAWTYIIPPLIGRLATSIFGSPSGTFTQHERAYKVWWLLIQLQTPFNRLPFIEELLRLVPGLYPAWIFLWGGHMSPFSYAAPGARVVDRHAIRIGRGAVLGLKSTVVSHMVTRSDSGCFVVLAEIATVEDGAILGGDSGIGPGAVVRSGYVLPVGKRLGPYAEWPRAVK